MKLKKLSIMMLIMMLSVMLVLAGCSGNNHQSSENPYISNSNSSTNKDEAATGNSNKNEEDGDHPGDRVTISWGTWFSDEIAEEIIAAFEASHPHINVENDTSLAFPDWNDKLAASAAAGQLPDVFWTFGVDVGVANDWLEDLTPFLEQDDEFKEGKVMQQIIETANYEGKQYALPHTLHAIFIILNTELFEKENIPVPESDWTVDDMKDAAIKLTKFNEHQFGFQDPLALTSVLVPQFEPAQGWNTWDGEKYNFSGQAFRDAYHYVVELLEVDKVSYTFYPQEQIDEWYGQGTPPWSQSKIGMKYGATWDLTGEINNNTFTWDIRPIPAAKGQRVPLVADYVAMNKNSEHKEAAFEFIKWLTYSKDGWKTKIERDLPLGEGVPIINDAEIWEMYLSKEGMPAGLKDILSLIPNGFIDPIKWLPGYNTAIRIYNEEIQKVNDGEAKLEDIVEDLDSRMNATYHEAVEAMNQSMGNE